MAIYYDTSAQKRYGKLGLAKAGLSISSENVVELNVQHPDFDRRFEQYSDTGEVQVIDGAYFVKYLVEDRDLEEVKKELKPEVAALRYEKEIEGTTLEDGTKVLTDRDTQAAANNVYTALANGIIATANWKGPEGWTTVTAETFLPIITAISAHVKKCFDAEFATIEAIDALATMDEIKAFNYQQSFDTSYNS
jgi:hypothetical protein